jgi:hypothetical protein
MWLLFPGKDLKLYLLKKKKPTAVVVAPEDGHKDARNMLSGI